MLDRDRIAVHQTLHGYGDGHQLLASSLELTREQQWQLMVMSDLSGPSFRAGFDGYLTGYPLQAGGFYCLAKTWFAPELPRPGCVWTHTLLLEDADVARLHDLMALRSLFHRPTSLTDRERYSNSVEAYLGDQISSIGISDRVATLFIALLYGDPTRKIVITASQGESYEAAIGAVFQQQWPRLRRSFRFCTGALAIRDVDFDLAIAPPTVMRQNTHGTLVVSAELSEASKVADSDDWTRVAAADLSAARDQTDLRRFLWTFGPDHANGRAAFRALCEVHLASAQAHGALDHVLSALAHFFPLPESNRRLKAAFFGVSDTFGRAKNEPAMLSALVLHPGGKCIPTDVALVTQRARVLVRTNPSQAVALAVASLHVSGVLASEFLTGFVQGIGDDPRALVEVPPKLLPRIIQTDPSLLTRSEFWTLRREDQSLIVAHLVSLPDAIGIAEDLVSAIIDAEAWIALQSVASLFGPLATSAVLGWIDRRSDAVLVVPDEALVVLQEHRDEVLQAVANTSIGSAALLAATVLLDPRSEDVRSLTPTVWVRLSGHVQTFGDPLVELRSKVFLLSVGLTDKDGVCLVRDGFAAVYEGAKEGGGLDDHLWSFVEPYLPWYRVTWDRCARLARGVVRDFVEHRWGVDDFLATFHTPEQLERALEEVSRGSGGSKYIRAVCRTRRDEGVLDAQRRTVLARYCGKKSDKSVPEPN